MKNAIFAMILTLILVSCGEKTIETTKVNHKEDTSKVEVESDVDVSMSTPSLFGGSGFGVAFVSYIKTQNYDLALQFTSKESIDKHGSKTILDMYKGLKVDYNLKQASESKEGGYTTLRYTTNEFATNKYKDFVVVVENDSCKLVLPDKLNDFLK